MRSLDLRERLQSLCSPSSVALSDLFSRRRKEHAESEVGASDAPVHPTKVLARFIAGLSSRSQPVLLDLGPVVGTNVSFFGEQLGCKIIVEDLSKDIDRHVRDGSLDQLPVPDEGFHRSPAASTASSAGMCSTTWIRSRRSRWPNSSFGCFGPTECSSRFPGRRSRNRKSA